MKIHKFRFANYPQCTAVQLPPVPKVGKGKFVWLRAKGYEWRCQVIKLTSFPDRAIAVLEFESEQQYKQFKKLKPVTGELLE